MSRGSQHSLVSGRGRSSRANAGVDTDARAGGSSNMKCIITVGIILPLLAAIIGVAAWSVGSESVHKRSQPSSTYHGGRSYYRSGDDIFSERNDNGELEYGRKLPIGAAVSKDILGPDVEEERDILPPTDMPAERDPLYVVHYVPQGPDHVTSEAPRPSAAPDILSKIVSASKVGSGKGTPQFVVFAPMANEEHPEEDEHHSGVINKRMKKRKKARKQIEEEDEYQENSRIRPHVTPVPRNGYYDSNDYQQNGWHQQQQQQQYNNQHFNNQQYNDQYRNQQQVPCCNAPQQGGATPTDPPKGVTISVDQGLPVSPLGILRQLIAPLLPRSKLDLRKKVFFGVQLENGFGFGGNNAQDGGGNAAAGGNTGGATGGNAQMGQTGHMGNMGNTGGSGYGRQQNRGFTLHLG